MTNSSDERPTISDWITFLSSEANTGISNYLSLGAFMFAALAIGVSVLVGNESHSPVSHISDFIVLGVVVVVPIWIYGKQVGSRTDGARKLLDAIMNGENRDVSLIEQRWKEILEKKKTKS